jgi:hypothetical protein
MGSVKPKVVGISAIKQKLLKPALSNHFYFYMPDPPSGVEDSGFSKDKEKILLSCCETSLPGSSLQTNDNSDKYHGHEIHYAYARQFDGSIDCSFYVDAPIGNSGYNVIMLFENWMKYIANPKNDGSHYASSRVRYPKDYMKNICILKFEKDYQFVDRGQINNIKASAQNGYLQYEFVDAYPLAVSSMPVSYDNSSLLKCSVTFSYNHYTVKNEPGSGSVNSISSSTGGSGGSGFISELISSDTNAFSSVFSKNPLPAGEIFGGNRFLPIEINKEPYLKGLNGYITPDSTPPISE